MRGRIRSTRRDGRGGAPLVSGIAMTSVNHLPERSDSSPQSKVRRAPAFKYVLITPARNEEAFLERTIQSVTRQSAIPMRWVIVSDGSTDRTDEIAKSYAEKFSWIDYVRAPVRSSRDFAGKVFAFRVGFERVSNLDYQFIGSVDADISFEANYFEYLLGKFDADPALGVAGTPFSEDGQTYDFRFSSTSHVSGACQMFRRECFESIGGYVPVKGGGIDDIAVMTARFKGWQTRTFTEMTCRHHRPMGTAGGRSKAAVNLKLGENAYRLGAHPLWQLARGIYQMSRKPYVVGGGALMTGYFWAMLRQVERPISKELVHFNRREQMDRLRRFVGGHSAKKP